MRDHCGEYLRRMLIITTEPEPICRWGKTPPIHDRFKRPQPGTSWRCVRSADCITATSAAPPEPTEVPPGYPRECRQHRVCNCGSSFTFALWFSESRLALPTKPPTSGFLLSGSV